MQFNNQKSLPAREKEKVKAWLNQTVYLWDKKKNNLGEIFLYFLFREERYTEALLEGFVMESCSSGLN